MTTESAIKENLKTAHHKLRSAVEKATREIADDVRVLQVNYGDGRVSDYTLYRGAWVNSQGGLRMMLIDSSDGCTESGMCTCKSVKWSECNNRENDGSCTRVLCSGDGIVDLHSHTYAEIVQVIQGTLKEVTTGRVYQAGDILVYPPNTEHQPHLNGMVLVCWQPPLERHKGAEA